MKISLEWLRDYASLDVPIENLVNALVQSGTEVDHVHHGLDGVIVAKILGTEPIPESTKGVILADLDVGGAEPVRVVTGAPNVKADDLVPYAQPGTLLTGWYQPLAVRAMFGGKYHSPGMLCSAVELGLSDDADGIYLLDTGRPGQPIHEILPLDVVFDIDVTTNRPDCMCHFGIARELAAALREPLRDIDSDIRDAHFSDASVSALVSVDVQDGEGCPRFAVRVIEGLTVAPSPPWLQRRLRAIGVRPINNIVDVTNYVTHELGQPLHAFDQARFTAAAGGGEVAPVVVRRARTGDTITCIDGVVRTLDETDLVVCASERVVSLAGVMGGDETAVDEATTTVLLEAASWDGPSIRATSNRHGVRTDASALFEKGLSDTLPPLALDRAAAMIAKLGGGRVLKDRIDVRVRPLPNIEPIQVTTAALSRLLGFAVDPVEAADALMSLGFSVEQDLDALIVTPPHFRRDVGISEDVVEEVARRFGYARIPSTLPSRRSDAGSLAPDPPADERVRDVMVGAGFDEAITWSFVSPALATAIAGIGGERTPLPLMNPLSEEWSLMRTSCLPGLCKALAGNLNRGLDDVSLFEIGRVYWQGERLAPPAGSTRDGADHDLPPLPAEPVILAVVAHAAGANTAEHMLCHIQSTLDRMSHDLTGHPLEVAGADIEGLRPGRRGKVLCGGTVIGLLGEVDDNVTLALGLRDRVVVAEVRLDALVLEPPRLPRYHAPPRFPAVIHDLAVIVATGTPAGDALAAIREAGGQLLDAVELYDEYRGDGVPEGHKGWTFRLGFRSSDRTLTGEEAKAAEETIAVALKVRCGAEIRR